MIANPIRDYKTSIETRQYLMEKDTPKFHQLMFKGIDKIGLTITPFTDLIPSVLDTAKVVDLVRDIDPRLTT